MIDAGVPVTSASVTGLQDIGTKDIYESAIKVNC
jgi:hypothetical protein